MLHKPARAANIGATARAMKVMGFTRLVLVAPGAPLDGEATAVAHGAHDVLEQAVMVVCYELLTSAPTMSATPAVSDARRQRMETLYRGLEVFLEEVGYPNRTSLARAMADARRVLDATHMTERNVNTVLGLFRHMRFLLRKGDAERG